MRDTRLSSCVRTPGYSYLAAVSFMCFVSGRQPRYLQRNDKRTSERISPRSTPRLSPSSPIRPWLARGGMTSLSPQSESACPQPESGMASSAACSNTLARMCYSTGQGACQQHANTTGDPPFQLGKTRLCSSTHSLPPTAATHACKLPSTTVSPFLLGRERSWEHQWGSS